MMNNTTAPTAIPMMVTITVGESPAADDPLPELLLPLLLLLTGSEGGKMHEITGP